MDDLYLKDGIDNLVSIPNEAIKDDNHPQKGNIKDVLDSDSDATYNALVVQAKDAEVVKGTANIKPSLVYVEKEKEENEVDENTQDLVTQGNVSVPSSS